MICSAKPFVKYFFIRIKNSPNSYHDKPILVVDVVAMDIHHRRFFSEAYSGQHRYLGKRTVTNHISVLFLISMCCSFDQQICKIQ
jgi:hypothetical protein